ncbi:hypothetical protein [Herbiconiux liangxiaofengii]|uniref:hypothetical protein n=1 Tax=Herbiconiux liangxiaofengii TaxID=3342795 RepID=UPI0035BB160D
MTSNTNDTDLTDGQLLELGRVAYWSAAIESSLREIVAALASRDPYNDEQMVRLLVRGAPINELNRFARVLLGHVAPSPDDVAYIAARLDRALDALSSRNHLLHGTWVSTDGKRNVVLEQRKGFTTTSFSDDEAVAVADKLSSAATEAIAALRVASGFVSGEILERMRSGGDESWLAERLLKANRQDPSAAQI